MTLYYEESGIQIYHGKAEDILPSLSPVDLVLTDPPYGINVAAKPNVGGTIKIKRKGFGDSAPSVFPISDWDKFPPDAATFDLIRKYSNQQIIWGGNYFPLPPMRGWLVWDKDNASTKFADCELAWTNLDMAVRKLRWRWNGLLQEDMSRKEKRVHHAQKPLALMKWCLGFAPTAKTICDPYMGSGSTLRAAKDLGLQAVGIEINEAYCEIAARRLQQEVLTFEPAVAEASQQPLALSPAPQ